MKLEGGGKNYNLLQPQHLNKNTSRPIFAYKFVEGKRSNLKIYRCLLKTLGKIDSDWIQH